MSFDGITILQKWFENQTYRMNVSCTDWQKYIDMNNKLYPEVNSNEEIIELETDEKTDYDRLSKLLKGKVDMVLKANEYRMNKSRLIGNNWGFINENYDKDDIKITNKTDQRVVEILGMLKKEQVRWQGFLVQVIGTQYEQMWDVINDIKGDQIMELWNQLNDLTTKGILDMKDSLEKDEVEKWLAHQLRKKDDDVTVYEESYLYGLGIQTIVCKEKNDSPDYVIASIKTALSGPWSHPAFPYMSCPRLFCVGCSVWSESKAEIQKHECEVNVDVSRLESFFKYNNNFQKKKKVN